jgi:8-oxo-dGTP pyrophosphatase MutT (NUDIX family)
MPIPDFIAALRTKIGHDLLLLPGVTAVVLHEERVLLGRRRDTGAWALIGGIMEPGEEAADALVREVLEETSVRVRPERVTGVYTHSGIVHSNGDLACYVVTGFRCDYLGGEPSPGDDELLETLFWPLDDLPRLSPGHRRLLDDALRDDPRAAFVPPAR